VPGSPCETNPLLGNFPTPGRVFWIGGVVPSLALIAAWLALPSEWHGKSLHWRTFFALTVTAVETGLVVRNHLTAGWTAW
jgi:hypothetical protein